MRRVQFDDGMVVELMDDGDTLRLFWESTKGKSQEFRFKLSHDALLVADRVRAAVRLFTDKVHAS